MFGNDDKNIKNANRDIITGEPGSHPIGTGVGGTVGGVAGAAAVGAAAGSAVGPFGTILGAVAGIFGGAAVGKSAAEAINPTDEDAYWEKNHATRSNVQKDAAYDDYRPAYHYGMATGHHTADSFDAVEPKLKNGWDSIKGNSKLTWDQAKDATRDAYNRVVQLHDEVLHADKKRVQAGEVNIRKEITTEQKTLKVPVEREELVIERRPAKAGQTGEIKAEEIRIPLSEERVTVSKETVLREEVTIGKRKVQETEQVSDTVRHENLKIAETGATRIRGDKELLDKKTGTN